MEITEKYNQDGKCAAKMSSNIGTENQNIHHWEYTPP